MAKRYGFNIAAYVHADFLYHTSLEQIAEGIEYFSKYCPVDKVYLETHRGLYDVPRDKMAQVKKMFADKGIEIAGGITSTVKIDGVDKNVIFDVFCFSDPKYRQRYLDIVRDTASQFDEIILDDFFFTACRCEDCIKAKGTRTWAQFRLDLMEEVSKEIVALAKQVNPKCKFVIKYPNWYESYQECGYNPGKQRDIFDGIYSGTESRDPSYSQQHLQRYLSYSIIRLLENTAPGRNGGGWIDQGGSSLNLSFWLEQAELTLFAKAKELMLFNFSSLINAKALPPLGQQLGRIDNILKQTGNPVGTSVYEPFDADGEDQLMNYLGMTGLALEPTPEFDDTVPVIFLAASAAHDKNIVSKLTAYVAKGGTAVITSGFFKKTLDAGITELTSARPTGRHVTGKEYWIDSYYANHKTFHAGSEEIGIEMLDHKTNATWCEIALVSGEFNFPLVLHDFYGKGDIYILNVPDNFSDLYKLPKDVVGFIAKVFAGKRRIYLNAAPRYNLFQYDNDVFGVYSYRPYREDVEVVVRGDEYKAIKDLETGEELSLEYERYKPVKRFDSAKTRDELTERVVRVGMLNGTYRFFKLVKK
ncbi:permease [Spirochaetia bacterium]|nr:permease [Spirochaetia bacterium]